jgi:hypothetical protein
MTTRVLLLSSTRRAGDSRGEGPRRRCRAEAAALLMVAAADTLCGCWQTKRACSCQTLSPYGQSRAAAVTSWTPLELAPAAAAAAAVLLLFSALLFLLRWSEAGRDVSELCLGRGLAGVNTALNPTSACHARQHRQQQHHSEGKAADRETPATADWSCAVSGRVSL